MGRFDDWKQYITDPSPEYEDQSLKHKFHPLDREFILQQEARLGRRFPGELREFYLEIGYGFMCRDDRYSFNRLMDPESAVDFYLGQGIHENDPHREPYNLPDHFVFFEVVEGLFLSLDLSLEDENGICPVYLYDRMIAGSLLEFLERMDQDCNYYDVTD